MTKEEFWILIFSDYQSYILITLISLTLLYIFLKKVFKSIFHPFFFYYILIFGFCISGVSYLFFKEKISEFYFFYYISAQFLFVIGLYVGKYFLGRKYKYSNRTINIKENSDFIYYFTVLTFVFFQLITYLFFGIPVFAASRWETYNSLAGAGIIGRIIEVARFIVIFYLVYKFSLINYKKTIFDYFTLSFLIITGFLTGSKMSILEFFFIAYISYYTLLYSGYNLKIYTFNFKKLFIYGFIVMTASLFTVYINQLFVNNASVNPLLLLGGRFVASPDLQIMTYPNDILKSLYSEHSILEIIFLDLKTLFNKLGFGFTHSSLGVEAFYYHYPYLKDELNSGPTSYYETLFLYHFGPTIGLLLSFLVGCFIGYFLFKKAKYNTLQKNLYYSAVAYLSIVVIINPQAFVGKIFGFILFYLFIYTLKQIIFGKNLYIYGVKN